MGGWEKLRTPTHTVEITFSSTYRVYIAVAVYSYFFLLSSLLPLSCAMFLLRQLHSGDNKNTWFSTGDHNVINVDNVLQMVWHRKSWLRPLFRTRSKRLLQHILGYHLNNLLHLYSTRLHLAYIDYPKYHRQPGNSPRDFHFSANHYDCSIQFA